MEARKEKKVRWIVQAQAVLVKILAVQARSDPAKKQKKKFHTDQKDEDQINAEAPRPQVAPLD